MSRESAGGAAAAGGVGNEGRWLAWALAHVLSPRPMPLWAGGRPVVAAGAQTERPADDFAAITEDEAWLTGQAKNTISVSTSSTSPLAEALKQVVAVYREPVPAGGSGSYRPVDPGRDRVLILAGGDSPATVNEVLHPLTNRLRGWPAEAPLEEAAQNDPEKNALKVIRDHLQSAWLEVTGDDLSDGDLRALLRLIGVRSLRLDDGQDLQDVRTALRGIAAEDDIDQVWHMLIILAQELDEGRQIVSRDALVHRLEAEGIALLPLTRIRPDIQRVRELAEENLRTLSEGVELRVPEGTVLLERSVSAEIRAAEANLALIGEAGAGKTAALCRLATDMRSAGHDVVLLTADDLSRSVREVLNLGHPLNEVLAAWPGTQPGYLLVDGLDQARSEDSSAWLARVMRGLAGTRWRIVVTIREFDLRYSERWQKMFRGGPASGSYQAQGLAHVRHILIGDFTDAEIDPLAASSPSLARLLETADTRLRRLLLNPFNLSLAASLMAVSVAVDFSQIVNRSELLHHYWVHRAEVPGAQAMARLSLLQRVVAGMLQSRSQSFNPVSLTPPLDDGILAELFHDGVLRRSAARPGHPGSSLAFSHPVLYDYAIALLALGDTADPQSVVAALDSAPDLAMTVRPSIEYRLATIWQDDSTRTTFWEVALRLAVSHGLAAAGAAKQAAEQISTEADLEPLKRACTVARPDANWTTDHSRRLLFLTARYLGLISRPEAMACLAATVAQLAHAAKDAADRELAGPCLQVAHRATTVAGISAATPGLASWATVARDCLALALSDPTAAAKTYIPASGLGLLASVAPYMPTTVERTLLDCIQPSVIDDWGPDVLFPIASRFDDLAQAAPTLAVAVARAVWQRTDSEDIPTTLLGNSSIFNLRSNRRQDLDGIRYEVACRYRALIQSAPIEAIRLVIEIVDAPERSIGRPSVEFPEPPHLRVMSSMNLSGPENDLLMLTAAVAASLSAEPRSAAPTTTATSSGGAIDEATLNEVIKMTLESLSNVEVWQKLLHTAAVSASPRLALAMAPVLESPNTFTHPSTFSPATYVAQRIMPEVDTEAQQRILAAVDGLVAIDPRTSTDPELAEHLRKRAADVRQTLEAALAGQPTPLPPIPEDPFGLPKAIFLESEPPTPDSPAHLDQQILEGHRLLSSADEAENEAGRDQLVALWAELRDRPDQAVTAERRVDLANRMARLVAVAPNTAVGAEVYETLTKALPGASAITPVIEPEVSELGGYYPSAGTHAVEGVLRLLSRRDWAEARGPQLRDLLRPFLVSDDYALRFVAARGTRLVHTELVDQVAALDARLRMETSKHIRAILLDELWRTRSDSARHIDSVLAGLAAVSGWEFLGAPKDDADTTRTDDHEFCIRILAALAVACRTPFASERCNAWLASPVAYPRTGSAIVTTIRDFLNPPDPTQSHVQTEAFRLLNLAIHAAFSAEGDVASAPRDSQRFAVAMEIGTQLYYTSGAMDERLQRPTDRGPSDRFAAHALPILQKIAALPDSRLTHHLIRTIDHLRATDTATIITIMGIAIAANPAYTFENQGAADVQKLVSHLISEHRLAVLSHPTGLATLRQVLTRFVDNGWDVAIDLYDGLTDLS